MTGMVELIKLAVMLGSAVASAAAWIYAWRAAHDRAERAELARLWTALEEERCRRRDDMGDLRDRLTRAESEVGEKPTAKALHEVALSIEHLAGDMRASTERLEGLGRVVERLERVTSRQEEFLLNRGPAR